jgi:hypothetical protein
VFAERVVEARAGLLLIPLRYVFWDSLRERTGEWFTRLVFHTQGSTAMEEFIHQENLALFKKCLAEPPTDAEPRSTLEVAGGSAGKRPSSDRWHSQAALICIKEPPLRKGLLLDATSRAVCRN